MDGPSYCSPAIGPDGTIYFGNDGVLDPSEGTYDGKLYAIAANGAERWEFVTGGKVRSCPAVSADGVIYFGSDDVNFYALNPDGTERWQFATQAAVESSPAIRFDGVVYFGGYDGNLYAIQGDQSAGVEPLADVSA